MNTPNSSILIIDDLLTNQKILSEILLRQGYSTHCATSGLLGLEMAAAQAPDLILLDINMPDMDGYETCQRFKVSNQLCDIPVIFISANCEIDAKLNGFKVGGVDYISKPFNPEDVIARVRTHLEIRRLQLDLKKRNHELKKLEQLRDNLVNMMVHDMRTHLTTIVAGSDLLELQLEGNVPLETQEDAATIKRSGIALIDMVDNLLDISRMESDKMPLKLGASKLHLIAKEAIASQALARQIKIVEVFSLINSEVTCDVYLTSRVINNLLSNAIKFSPDAQSVVLAIEAGEHSLILSVTDKGPGVPKDQHKNIFEKFNQVDDVVNRQHSSGLGLSFCKLAMESQQGNIGIDSHLKKGSRFWISLPRAIRIPAP